MNIVKELYKVARKQEVELSLQETIKVRNEAEKKIFDEVNKIQDLEIIDLIAMMVPMAVCQYEKPEYFNELFGGAGGVLHAETLKKVGLPYLADTQRIIQTVFGVSEDQKFLISLKEDKNSPAKYSLKKLMLLIDPTNLALKGKETASMLATLGIPDEQSVSILFDDELTYTEEDPDFNQNVLSNLINTFILTHMAAKEPKIFDGHFNYKVSGQMGRSTYKPDEGEVLFEVSQTKDAPMEWFEIFDKVDLPDFDLKTELTTIINTNLLALTSV